MGGCVQELPSQLLAESVEGNQPFHDMEWTIVKPTLINCLCWSLVHYLSNHNLGLADSASFSCAYMSVISFAKYAFACGLLTYKIMKMKCQRFCISIPSNSIDGPTLNVGVRRPFSSVNGSATRVIALTNSKPRSWYNNKHRSIIREHLTTSIIKFLLMERVCNISSSERNLCFLPNRIHVR
jgi:hypothetical protein